MCVQLLPMKKCKEKKILKCITRKNIPKGKIYVPMDRLKECLDIIK